MSTIVMGSIMYMLSNMFSWPFLIIIGLFIYYCFGFNRHNSYTGGNRYNNSSYMGNNFWNGLATGGLASNLFNSSYNRPYNGVNREYNQGNTYNRPYNDGNTYNRPYNDGNSDSNNERRKATAYANTRNR